VYLFLLVCVTGNGQDMLRLSAVQGCGLGDNQILLLTVGSMLGSLAGFKYMGRLIDHLGPQRVLLLCHIGFAVALLLFPVRVVIHVSPLIAAFIASMVLGLISSTLGLTTTAQSFRICRGAQRTIAYALISATQSLGSGLSGFALAALLAHLGTAIPGGNPFDLILFGLAVFVLLLIAVLRVLYKNNQGVDRVAIATGAT
jgi:MFS family permease